MTPPVTSHSFRRCVSYALCHGTFDIRCVTYVHALRSRNRKLREANTSLPVDTIYGGGNPRCYGQINGVILAAINGVLTCSVL